MIKNRKVKKIERQLLKIFNENYEADGSFVNVLEVCATDMDDWFTTLKIVYGNNNFCRQIELVYKADGKFIQGQFFQAILEEDKK